MNLDNKFGECCKCPAKIQDGRIYTSYVPRRDYNTNIMKEVKASDSHQYRSILQAQGESIITAIQTNLENTYRCTNNGTNIFNKSVDIHKFFNDQLQSELNKPVSEVSGINT